MNEPIHPGTRVRLPDTKDLPAESGITLGQPTNGVVTILLDGKVRPGDDRLREVPIEDLVPEGEV